MAKTKPPTNAPSPSKPPKKSHSTSAIFKKARKQPSRKDQEAHQHPQNPPPFSLSTHVAKKKPSSKQKQKHKRAASPPHALSKAFNASLSPTLTHITTSCTTAATSINSDLQSRISTSASTHTARVTTSTTLLSTLYHPLADEGINYARRDGSQSTRTTLGAQIKMFERKIGVEEKVLEGLVRELGEVEGELEGLVGDVFGREGERVLARVEKGDLVEVLGRDGEDGDGRGMEEGMGEEYKAFEELINTTGENALEKMIESEKEFKIKQNERTQYMLKLFADDDDVGEE